MTARFLGWALILNSVALESCAQLCMKKAAMQTLSQNFGRLILAIGIILYAVETIVWTLALHATDVSVAYPMGSLSFVGVALLSAFWLKEKVSAKRWLGIVLILLGTAMVGLT